jgi:hypothetical protein
LTAPTGIAARNINGRTLNSLFAINPYSYDKWRINTNVEELQNIRCANILVIDEVSMNRLDLMDKVDERLRLIRGNDRPFGGIRVIFFGDLMQLEPVVTMDDNLKIKTDYPFFEGNAFFYKSKVLSNIFLDYFDIYNLCDIFRQNDTAFLSILNEIRYGKVRPSTLNYINDICYKDIIYYDDSYHYLTKTNVKAASINNYFIDKLSGIAFQNVPYYSGEYGCSKKSPISGCLTIKKGMKIMFVINDNFEKSRWANGTMGTITEINHSNEYVLSVKVKISDKDENKEYNVERISYPIYNYSNNEYIKTGEVNNFPFIPSYATTIDKVQGLTLKKIAIIMENDMRPQQVYVALSRAQSISDIMIFEHRLSKRQIKVSPYSLDFYDLIKDKLINVHNEPSNTIINNITNIYITGEKQKITVTSN